MHLQLLNIHGNFLTKISIYNKQENNSNIIRVCYKTAIESVHSNIEYLTITV